METFYWFLEEFAIFIIPGFLLLLVGIVFSALLVFSAWFLIDIFSTLRSDKEC